MSASYVNRLLLYQGSNEAPSLLHLFASHGQICGHPEWTTQRIGEIQKEIATQLREPSACLHSCRHCGAIYVGESSCDIRGQLPGHATVAGIYFDSY